MLQTQMVEAGRKTMPDPYLDLWTNTVNRGYPTPWIQVELSWNHCSARPMFQSYPESPLESVAPRQAHGVSDEGFMRCASSRQYHWGALSLYHQP